MYFCLHVDDILYVLWSEAHAETGQVSIAEGEEDHENDVPGVVSEHHGQVVSGLNVTEHEERNEHQACDDQDGQPDAVFTGLNREQRAQHFNIMSTDIHHHLQSKPNRRNVLHFIYEDTIQFM